jgi:hypothetical protein
MSDAENRACLESLRATNPRHDKKRIEQEKGGLLRDSYSWVLNHVDFQHWRKEQTGLLWIRGDPGKGKTMLLCGIIDDLIKSTAHTSIISFFFCQATRAHINNSTAVLRGLIYMLVKQQPSLISYLRDIYDDGKDCFQGVNAWVALSEVFSKMLEDLNLQNTYLVIDALDECVVDSSLLLNFIVEKSSAYSHVKWIVSSRNWPSIEERLRNAKEKVNLSLELNQDTVSAAVSIYIKYKVAQLATEKGYDIKMRNAVQHHLQSNANDTFLWVALVCEELRKTLQRHTRFKLEAFPPGLDELYRRMMDQICDSEDAELCKGILAVISVVYQPVTLDELVSFVEIPTNLSDDKYLAETIALCGSFLKLQERTVSFVHQSAKDFLVEKATGIFLSGIKDVHYTIFSQSLQVLRKVLRRDVYSLRAPGITIGQVKQPDPDPLAAVRYSCLYWVDHLLECQSSEETIKDLKDSGPLYSFLRQYFLYWLEALSLLKSMSEGIYMVKKLENLPVRFSYSLIIIELS